MSAGQELGTAPISQDQYREVHHYIPAHIEGIRGLASRGVKRIKVRLKAVKGCKGAQGVALDHKGTTPAKMYPNV